MRVPFTVCSWIIAVTILAPSLLSSSGWAAPIELAELLEAPLNRFFLMHTRDGIALSERILGARSSVEAYESRWTRLQSALMSERWSTVASELEVRLRQLDVEARAELERGGTQGNRLTQLEDLAANHLAVTAAEPTDAAGVIHFLSERPSPSYATERAQLLADTTESGHLRFSRWRGVRLGDLRGEDLRGADLRGASVSATSQLEGAVYDQFTGLPFSRAEATARGMIYSPSTPPEQFYFVDVESAVRSSEAAAGGDRATAEQRRAAAAVLRDLPTRSPENARGVTAFAAPSHVKARGSLWVRFEAGRLTAGGGDPMLEDLIAELARDGGEVRRLVAFNPRTSRVLRDPMAYFSLDGRKPTIAISEQVAVPTLHHERAHLRDWMDLLRKYAAPGRSEDEVFRLASAERATARYKAFTERNAVIAGLQAEAVADEAAGVPLVERRWRYENRNFAATVTYPEREGLRRVFADSTLAEVRANPTAWADAERFCRRIIRTALISRRGAFRNLGLRSAAEFTADGLFYEVIAGNRLRYSSDGSLEDIHALFNELLPSEVTRLPDDDFKTAIRARF